MRVIKRSEFISSLAGIYGLAHMNPAGTIQSVTKSHELIQQSRTVRLKGRQDSSISHWDIITIGNLSRNRYWGESDERALHGVICTCSVISGKDFHLIVDPSIADETAMKTELTRRTGLSPDKINAVFITHQHGDHIAGLKHFPNAVWYSGSAVASALNKTNQYSNKIEAAGTTLFGVVDVLPTPGHTPDHNSLRFDYRGMSIVVAGDAVATHDFWDERQSYYNVIDKGEAERSMGKIDSVADIIIPGHDNYFFNLQMS